jgi:formylglycine-generating enzyme required for sulfatase activity
MGQWLPEKIVPPPGTVAADGGSFFRLRDPADGEFKRSFGQVPKLSDTYKMLIMQLTPGPGVGELRRASLSHFLDYEKKGYYIFTAAGEPQWPRDQGPQSDGEQLKFLGLELRDFVGWSDRFGAVHRTQKEDLFVGLGDGPRGRQVAHVVRLAADPSSEGERKARGWASYTEVFVSNKEQIGKLTTLPDVSKALATALASRDAKRVRAAVPRPLPAGAAGEQLAAALAPAWPPFRSALDALPSARPSSAGALPAAIFDLGRLQSVIEDHGGPGSDLPPDLRQSIARRVDLFIAAVEPAVAASPNPVERELLGVLGRFARAQRPWALASGDVGELALQAPRFALASRELTSSALSTRAEAFNALQRLAGEAQMPRDLAVELGALAGRLRPGLTAELEGQAIAAESRGLKAISAAWWLLLHQARGRETTGAAHVGWPWTSEAISPLAHSRRLVASLYRDLVPVFPAEKTYANDLDWPARKQLGLQLATDADRQASGVRSCTVEAGPVRYSGDFRIATTRVPGKPTGRYVQRTVAQPQTRTDWEREVAAKRQEIAELERDSESSSEMLGSIQGGTASGVRTARSPDGKVTEFVVDRQSIYIMGAKEAAEKQAARMQDAKRRLPLAKYQLAELIKNGPAKGRTESEWVPDGGREPDGEIRWRKWLGQGSRLLQARCAGSGAESYQATETFDAERHSNPERSYVPAKGFETPDALASAMARNDEAERPEALAALSRAVIKGRIEAWRTANADRFPGEAAAEAAWRNWFFGVDASPPANTPVVTASVTTEGPRLSYEAPAKPAVPEAVGPSAAITGAASHAPARPVKPPTEVSGDCQACPAMLVNPATQSKKDDTAKPAGKVAKDCALCPEMVRIPAGSFDMGSDDGDKDEKPAHRVNVPAFALGKYEVTQSQWRAVMGSDPPELDYPGCGNCPVEHVSWDDAQGFLKKLNAATGMQFRLPSEAEWEYACRAGGHHKYCGSDDVDAVAWHSENYAGHKRPVAPVGQKQPNAFGLYDMSGNLWELTADCWNANYIGAPTNGSAWTTGDCGLRVQRGGAWASPPRGARSASRHRFPTGMRYGGGGFRVALSMAGSN